MPRLKQVKMLSPEEEELLRKKKGEWRAWSDRARILYQMGMYADALQASIIAI